MFLCEVVSPLTLSYNCAHIYVHWQRTHTLPLTISRSREKEHSFWRTHIGLAAHERETCLTHFGLLAHTHTRTRNKNTYRGWLTLLRAHEFSDCVGTKQLVSDGRVCVSKNGGAVRREGKSYPGCFLLFESIVYKFASSTHHSYQNSILKFLPCGVEKANSQRYSRIIYGWDLDTYTARLLSSLAITATANLVVKLFCAPHISL